jgi:prolyl-tRNA synthetase
MLRSGKRSRSQRSKHSNKNAKAHIKGIGAGIDGKEVLLAPKQPFSQAAKPKTTAKSSKSAKKHPKHGSVEVNLDSFQLSTLPTPHAVIIGEQLQEEEEKQFRDSKSPLRSSTAHGFSFDLPQMSRLHVPTILNIRAINNELEKAKVSDQNLFLKTPDQLIPNWSKLTTTEQLLLQSGFIAVVNGSNHYTYLPMAMRVLQKLTDLINDEMLSTGSQQVDMPTLVEKNLLDQFQLYRQKMVKENEAINSLRGTKKSDNEQKNKKDKKRDGGDDDGDGDDGDGDDDNEDELILAQSPYDHPTSPYYRFYNLQDEELVVSPPLLDYYTTLVKSQVKLAQQLPLSFYQFSKKMRDLNDTNAILNSSTNISESNADIGYMHLNEKQQQQQPKGSNKQSQDDDFGDEGQVTNPIDGIQPHPAFKSKKSHQTETLMNGLITSTEYHTLNSVTFHHDANDAHSMYKHTLELFNRIFRKLGVRGVQVEADGGKLGAELSHEYHLIIGPTSDAPVLKPGAKNKDPIPTNTHALVQCGLCNYTANTENAQFGVSEVFDQVTYNKRMKTGDLTRAMRQDPRSFGIFEPTGGDPQFDRDIRSKATGLVKQMLPNLARRDVPMVANVVKLIYGPGQDGFYDLDGEDKDSMQFINHAVIMLRADREFNPRAIARHFGCYEVELLTAAESALLLLKFQKFKQKQYQELITAGVVEAFDPNFNIFSELLNKPLAVSAKDVDKMYENMNDMTLIEKEQRRLRRLAARRDVNAGLVVICDNTLAASGIDLDDQEMMSEKFLHEQNQDRSFGLKMADATKKNQGRNLIDKLDGYKTATDFQSSQNVPPEFAKQFEIIFKGIKEGIITVSKEGDIVLNEVSEELQGKYPEFINMPPEATVEEFKRQLLKGPLPKKNTNGDLDDIDSEVDMGKIIDADVVEVDGQKVDVLRTKNRVSFSREEIESVRAEFLEEGVDIDDLDSSDFENITDVSDSDDIEELSQNEDHNDVYEGQILPILQNKDVSGKTTAEIFESAMEDSRTHRKQKFDKRQRQLDHEDGHDHHGHEHEHGRDDDPDNSTESRVKKTKKSQKEQSDDEQINMYQNEHGDLVDEHGQVLPHITSDLPATPDVRRAFGKKGYDQLADGDEFGENQGSYDERLLSTVNPSQGDFTAPQTGDKCLQSACQAQGMLEGLRSIEIGKVFYLADSMTRNTDAVIINNKPNKQGVISYKKEPMHMTSAKIGVSRLMHALIESGQHDEFGLIWPELIAPFQISIISDPTIPVNFGRTQKRFLDKRGKYINKNVDVYENYIEHAELAEEEYNADLKAQSKRFKELKKIPGVTPSLDKQRNLLIGDAEELIDNDAFESSRLQFGYWNWGLADNHAHSLNMATTIAKSVPTLEDDIVYDDRHHMSINQRVQDSFAMGIPWVIVIDEMMQEKGLMKVVNRAKRHVEHLSVDQIIHFFNGQRPLHQRPDSIGTDFERQMKYRVENALMGHFGKKAAHEGDSEFFKITTNSDAFDYNTHVDLETRHDEEYDAQTTPRFDEDGQVVNTGKTLKEEYDNTQAALKAQDEASKTGEISDKTLQETGADDGKSQMLDDSIEDAIKSLNSRGEGDKKKDAPATPQKQGKAIDEWYHTIKKMRRKLPPPTADELDRMFRVGILYKDAKGEVQVNGLRAEENLHVVYGVDPHVVDQFERGNLLDLDRTGTGVKQVVDKLEYLQQQKIFTAQRIEKQISSGFFDLALTPENRHEKFMKQKDYFDWQTKQEKEMAKSSVFNQVKYSDAQVHFTDFNEKRREDLKRDGVVFRSIRDGSAIIHRPGVEPEQKPFDIKYNTLSNDTNPFSQPPEQVKKTAFSSSQTPIPRPLDVEVPARRPKKSLTDIFSGAPVQQPREGDLYEEVFGKNTHIKDNFGEDAYSKIFGNKNAK